MLHHAQKSAGVQVCDARNDDSSNAAWLIKMLKYVCSNQIKPIAQRFFILEVIATFEAESERDTAIAQRELFQTTGNKHS